MMTYQWKGTKLLLRLQFSATVSRLYNQPMAVVDFPEWHNYSEAKCLYKEG